MFHGSYFLLSAKQPATATFFEFEVFGMIRNSPSLPPDDCKKQLVVCWV